MKSCSYVLSLVLALACTTHPIQAADRHVWQDSPSPGPPYGDWASAAHSIQDAVDAAVEGDTVLVGNGIYATGGRAVTGTMTNRVAIDKAIRVEGVSGPAETLLVGDADIRCVYLGTNAVLSGFTLTNGHTRGFDRGGGVWCESGGVVTNCVLTGNSAEAGGGAYGGTLYNCIVSGNSANWAGGGGAAESTLYNCTLTANSAWGGTPGGSGGGGASESTLYNCTLTGNSAWPAGGGAFGSTLYNCTLTDNWTRGGTEVGGGGGAGACTLYNCTLTGNSAQYGGGAFWGTLYNCTLTGNSATFGGGASESTLYNCTLTGNSATYGGGTGHATLYNCIVYYNSATDGPNYSGSTFAHSCTTPLPPGEGNIDAEPLFMNAAAGDYRLAYGSPCIDTGTNLSAIVTNDLDGNPRPLDGNGDGIAAFDMGAYEVVPAHYVWQGSSTPTPPYGDWDTAACSIQEAVDAAVEGDTVLVGNGIYATGGRAVTGTMTNRVAIDKAIRVEGVSGPAETLLVGDADIRCVYLGTNAVLSGFTLTNGHTRGFDRGGGVWCESGGVVTNCVLTGNSAAVSGGGACGGTLYNCIVSGNSANWAGGGDTSTGGGGAFRSTLYNCTLTGNSATFGGGASGSTLYNCALTSNSVGGEYGTGVGGGACGSTLYNCTLTSNSARGYSPFFLGAGGGASGSRLYSCTLTGNRTDGSGGGVWGGTLHNCIVYFNAAHDGPNYSGSTFAHSCTTPLPPGEGNIDADPLFVNRAAGDFRLAYGSPCIDAGTNLSVLITADFDGNPRPLDGNGDGVAAFDMGAYEFDLRTVVPTDWFIRYGLDPTDPNVFSGNPDNDCQTTFQEWMADTDPTNDHVRFPHRPHRMCVEWDTCNGLFPEFVQPALHAVLRYATSMRTGRFGRAFPNRLTL